MHKVSSAISPTIGADEMKMGDVMHISAWPARPDHVGKHLLRTYDSWVLLEAPSCTWSDDAPQAAGGVLPKGATLTIVIGG